MCPNPSTSWISACPGRCARKYCSPSYGNSFSLCPQTSTGTGIAGIESSAARVLWLSYTGGNTREWSLYTATTSARKGRLLRFVARDVDGPPGIVLGRSRST